MIFVEGKDSILYIKHDGVWVPISCEISSGMNESSDMVNTTTRDNKGWTTSRPNMQSYSIDLNGQTVLDADDSILNYWKLVSIKRDRVLIEWQRRTSNRMMESGFAYISNISTAYPMGEFVTFDATLEGFGKPRLIDNKYGVLADFNDDALVNNNNNAINII